MMICWKSFWTGSESRALRAGSPLRPLCPGRPLRAGSPLRPLCPGRSLGAGRALGARAAPAATAAVVVVVMGVYLGGIEVIFVHGFPPAYIEVPLGALYVIGQALAMNQSDKKPDVKESLKT